MRILILGARAPACLEWARAFYSEGHEVIVADSLAWPLTRFSRSVQQFLHLPEPRTNPTGWCHTLCTFIEKNNIDWIIPTCEEVFYLAWFKEHFDNRCQIFTSDFELLHQLHHKGYFAQSVAAGALCAPETHIIENNLLPAVIADNCHEWVFKPAYSRFATHTLIRPNRQQLAHWIKQQKNIWIAQKFIAGREHCSFGLLQNGKLIAHSCYHPRYRVGRGAGVYFEVTAPDAILQFVQRIGAQTGYTGQIGFDFIEDENGYFHVLECNPRATSGVHLFDNQYHALINALITSSDQRTVKHLHQPLLADHTPRMVTLAMLLFAAPKNGLSKTFWRDFYNARDVVRKPNDAGPLLAQLPGLAEITTRAIMRRCGLLAAATADIEWDGLPIERYRSKNGQHPK